VKKTVATSISSYSWQYSISVLQWLDWGKPMKLSFTKLIGIKVLSEQEFKISSIINKISRGVTVSVCEKCFRIANFSFKI